MTSLSYVYVAATDYEEFTIFSGSGFKADPNLTTQIFKFGKTTVVFGSTPFYLKLVGGWVESKRVAIKARESYSFMQPGIMYVDPKPDGLAVQFGPLCQLMSLKIVETE